LILQKNFSFFLKFALMLFLFSSSVYGDVTIDNDGGLVVEKDDMEFEINGLLMWDFNLFDGAHLEDPDATNLEDDFQVRRARLTLKGKSRSDWQAKLHINFLRKEALGDNSVEIGDAYIKYNGWDFADIFIGQHKELFGFERITSSKDTTFIERAMCVNAFSPGRQPGLSLKGAADSFFWSGGVYRIQERDEEIDQYAVTGRLAFNPVQDEHSLLHLGIAGSARDYSGEEFKIEETAEIYTAKEAITSDMDIESESVYLLGLEAALIKGPFSFQSEYIMASVNAISADNTDYSGYYIQGSYFITGELKSYKKGTMGSVESESDKAIFEIAYRYSSLDARDNNTGIKGINHTLGLNIYFDQQVRLMTNYINTRLKGDVEGESNGNAFLIRLQYGF